MLLTIRTTHQPATDLGFLLHKHPDHVHTREFPFGNATSSIPEASEEVVHGGRPARRRSGRDGSWPRRQGRRRGSVRQRPAVRRVVAALGRAIALVRLRPGRPMRAEARAVRIRAAARGTACGGPLPRRRGVPPGVVRAARLHGRSDPPRARREHPGARAEPVLHGDAASDMPAERPADAPVRADSGSRRSEALLGRRRRGREAASARRGLARTSSVARCHRLALPRASARTRSRRHRPADGGGTARRGGRGAQKDEQEASIERTHQPERAAARRGVRGAEGVRRDARARSRLRRGEAAAAALWPIGSSRRSSAWTSPDASSSWPNRA